MQQKIIVESSTFYREPDGRILKLIADRWSKHQVEAMLVDVDERGGIVVDRWRTKSLKHARRHVRKTHPSARIME